MNMGYNNDIEDHYEVPILAKLLHALPHYNITFHRTNNTFRPTDEIYLEALGILGSVPAALLIISLFGLLLYLMTRCCDRKPRPAHSITSLKVTLSIVTVLCCAAIALGLYGNDDLHNGLLEVLAAGRKVDNVVNSVRNQTNILEHTLTQRIRPQMVELADIFETPASNQTALSQLISSVDIVQGNITIATNAASDIRRPLMGISMNAFLNKGDQYELIRWPGTVAVLALLLVLCAFLLIGVARHSRCALIFFSVCGLLAVTGSWLMSGLYLSTSVAVGDLCTNPAGYLVSQSPQALPSDVLLYYTQCESARSNPFTQRLRESQNAINNARNSMHAVSKISVVLFRNAGLPPKLGSVQADLNNAERLLTGLTALVDCKAIHFSYMNATQGLCEGGLLGLVLMLIASFIAAILLTVMVWVDSHTWIYIRKRNDYNQVEEQSYASHQQQGPNHPNMARTLPRQQNGPPAISGSHTLQHPNKNKHQNQNQEMVPAPHHHLPQMRPMGMGTHTLGRLPSHNHSPNHMMGPNNACSDHQHPTAAQMQQYATQQQMQQQMQAMQNMGQYGTHGAHPQNQGQHPPPPHVHFKQYPNNYPEVVPQIPNTTAAPQTISGNPTYTQQQQIYIQQQQIYMAQQQQQQQQQYQTLRRKQQMQPQMTPQPIPTSQAIAPGSQAQMNQLVMQQQQVMASHLPPPPQHMINPQMSSQYIMSTASTQPPPPATIVTANNSIYVQSKTYGEAPMPNNKVYGETSALPSKTYGDNTAIPTSVDSAMYERDKQIYKCSTLRHGGKYDQHMLHKAKGGVPATIPTVPQIPKFNNVAPPQANGVTTNGIRPSIQNCPLPEIPKVPISIPVSKELPHNRFYTQKRIPTGKNIPLPKIGSFDSPNISGNNVINNNHGTQVPALNNHAITTISNSSDNNSNIKNSINNNSITNNQLNNNQATVALANNVMSPTDEKNSEFYAVTEL